MAVEESAEYRLEVLKNFREPDNLVSEGTCQHVIKTNLSSG